MRSYHRIHSHACSYTLERALACDFSLSVHFTLSITKFHIFPSLSFAECACGIVSLFPSLFRAFIFFRFSIVSFAYALLSKQSLAYSLARLLVHIRNSNTSTISLLVEVWKAIKYSVVICCTRFSIQLLCKCVHIEQCVCVHVVRSVLSANFTSITTTTIE